jgi:predicted lactoylglutathione lyase
MILIVRFAFGMPNAMTLGASCEGKPGFRPAGATQGFYAGYFRDLDGNKLNAFCMVGDTHLPAE